MNVNFAGSRHLDERRRRRLAGESEGTSTGVLPQSPPAASARPESGRRTPARSQLDFPLSVLISPKLWKHGLVLLFGTVLCAFLLAGGYDSITCARFLGPGIARLLSLSTGQVIVFTGSLLLLMAAELALLIGWVRSESAQDFAGRYRIWSRATGVFLLFALSAATGAHWAFSETLLSAVAIEFWQSQTLCWLVPSIILGLVLLWHLHRDMRRSRISLVLLWLGAGLCLVSSILKLMPPLEWLTPWRALVGTGSLLFGQLSLFLSMLLHCRYVIYICADPPDIMQKQQSRTRKNRVAAPVLERPTDDLPADDAATPADSDLVPQATSPKPKKFVAATRKENLAAGRRIDEVGRLPKPNLKGLSKQERRRLQKEWREKQREMQAQSRGHHPDDDQ